MRVGFIGLGNVGHKLANNLADHGFDLMVRDLDRNAAKALEAKGVAWADSGREMAEACDVVITCLPSPKVSAEVMEAPCSPTMETSRLASPPPPSKETLVSSPKATFARCDSMFAPPC